MTVRPLVCTSTRRITLARGVLVQPLVGLVQGQHIILREQGTTQGHPALHSAAERGYRLRKAFGGNTQLKQQLRGLRDGRTGRRRTFAAAVNRFKSRSS